MRGTRNKDSKEWERKGMGEKEHKRMRVVKGRERKADGVACRGGKETYSVCVCVWRRGEGETERARDKETVAGERERWKMRKEEEREKGRVEW